MKKPCCIEGCEKPVVGRSMCAMHWTRWKKHGDPHVVKSRWDGHQKTPHVCDVPGCERLVYKRRMCSLHERRRQKYGDPLVTQPRGGRRESVEARFAAKTRQEGSCLVWTASLNQGGYGAFRALGEYTAHRVAWVLAHGEIPDGMCVLHRCDNRRCVNIDHLWLGTYLDNVRDMERKGRARHPSGKDHGTWRKPESVRRGAGVGTSKLTDDQVRQIRRRYVDGETQGSIARDIGISQTTVSRIVLKQTWAHIG